MAAESYSPAPGINAATSRPSPRKRKGGIRSLRIETSDNGGFIVTCDHDQTAEPGYKEPSRYTYESIDDVVAELKKKFK